MIVAMSQLNLSVLMLTALVLFSGSLAPATDHVLFYNTARAQTIATHFTPDRLGSYATTL